MIWEWNLKEEDWDFSLKVDQEKVCKNLNLVLVQ